MSVTALEHYLAEFTRVEAILPGRRLPWLTRARKEARATRRIAGDHRSYVSSVNEGGGNGLSSPRTQSSQGA